MPVFGPVLKTALEKASARPFFGLDTRDGPKVLVEEAH
jgi:hypothetical protein